MNCKYQHFLSMSFNHNIDIYLEYILLMYFSKSSLHILVQRSNAVF